jgi:hypothetical protein
MTKSILFILAIISIISCNVKTEVQTPGSTNLPLEGTWQLISGTLIEKGNTTVTDYTKKQSFIKIINNSHFAFLSHDLSKGKDSAASFCAGGGKYTLKDSTYTEHLEYCNDRQWEGNDFSFTISIINDTLVQKGVEKIAGTNIDRYNIERYKRVK